jgi:glycosyltransferase involved in cell wall biosynthesis
VPLSELPKYYRGALALVTPALYEGFGLPIVEAMACGCPIIASTNSAMPEIVGNAGLLVDAADTQAISGAMEKIAEDADARRRLVKKSISQAKLYSWHEFARGVLDDIYSYCAVKN